LLVYSNRFTSDSHPYWLTDCYNLRVCAKTARDLKLISVAQRCGAVLVFLSLSLSYRGSWNDVCLYATVQRAQNLC